MDDLANHIPYLAELGITHVYLSPIYTARPGSTHGYDVVDHSSINPELGGCEGWRQLCHSLRAYSLGAVLDIVPNHMAADPVHNLLWRQVLADGPSSVGSRYFDVDWQPLSGLIRNKVMLPVLEEPYGEALLQRRIRLEREGGETRVRYSAVHLPLSSRSFESDVSEGLLDEIDADPQSMHEVLERQHYRLAFWRAASDEINYRRFFDVNDLIAIRAEDDYVFEGSHRLILQLAQDEVVHGLRVDHVDGLLEPAAYLQRLRSAGEEASRGPMWIVVEKILGRQETLDPGWAVDGTTGYDALNVLNRLFISGRGVRMLRHFYQTLFDEQVTFREVAYRSKRLVMVHTLRSGFTLLTHALKRVADASWMTRDITLNALTTALVELIARLQVYRTYIGGGSDRQADREAVEQAYTAAIRHNPSMDQSALRFLRSLLLDPPDDSDPALAKSRRDVVKRLEQYTSGVHAKGIEDTSYYRDNTLLALNEVGGDPGGPSGTLPEFHRFNERRARRWPHAQTATSTHDTKLGEDTRIRIATLSVYAREWITAVREWTRLNSAFRRASAKGLSPDINDEYRLYQVLVGVWPAEDLNGGGEAESALVDRMVAYMRKAVREARVHTSWLHVDEEYEAGLEAFVRDVMTDVAAGEFRESLRSMARRILPLSVCHSMSQLTLKCLMPGVPDFYQSDESWALVVTDPDNRRPVDFDAARESLGRLFAAGAAPRELRAASPHDVLACDLKRYVSAQLLRFRRSNRELMSKATYVPIRARGARAPAIVAFRRTYQRQHVVVGVPRLVERSLIAAGWPAGSDFWRDTELRVPSRVREWRNVLTGCTTRFDQPGRASLARLTEGWPWVVLYGCE